MDYSKIITLEPGKRSGKPCIRGLRITVGDVLGYLGLGHDRREFCETSVRPKTIFAPAWHSRQTRAKVGNAGGVKLLLDLSLFGLAAAVRSCKANGFGPGPPIAGSRSANGATIIPWLESADDLSSDRSATVKKVSGSGATYERGPSKIGRVFSPGNHLSNQLGLSPWAVLFGIHSLPYSTTKRNLRSPSRRSGPEHQLARHQ